MLHLPESGQYDMYKFINAIRTNDISTINRFIESGIDIDREYITLRSMTILMYACVYDCIFLVELLIGLGVIVNKVDYRGMTALMHVSYRDYTECGELLCNAGADIDIRDNSGKSALDYAMYSSVDCSSMVELLSTYKLRSTVEGDVHFIL